MNNNLMMVLISFVVSLIIFAILFIIVRILTCKIYDRFIPFIKNKHYGQVVRQEGMDTHLIKAGTPTMGGIVFVAVLVAVLILIRIIALIISRAISISYQNICLLIYILGFLALGYKDDKSKILKNSADGLKAIHKFIFQIIISLIFIFLIFYLPDYINVDPALFIDKPYRIISIPIVNFFKVFDMSKNIYTEIIFVILNVFILAGVANGTNFTDGIDSLLANVTIVISIFFMIYSLLMVKTDLFLFNLIMCAVLFGFRKYNKYPAKIFMGDTGSLAIGAYVGGMSMFLGIQFKLPIFGFIYMVEVISVILQVSYFKITHGKRIFLMAPIHHHFEKLGWSEKKVVKVFTILTIVLCIISLII